MVCVKLFMIQFDIVAIPARYRLNKMWFKFQWSFLLMVRLKIGYQCFNSWLFPTRTDDDPGGRLNKKDGLTRYGDSHVKDKTS